jgi:ligand-binding sensor domain-containing protein
MQPFPKLPPAIATLVRSGIYTIFEVSDGSFLLFTKAGLVHSVSNEGAVSTPLVGKSIADFSLKKRIRLDGDAPYQMNARRGIRGR